MRQQQARSPTSDRQPIAIGFAYAPIPMSIDCVLKSQHETALLISGSIPRFDQGASTSDRNADDVDLRTME
jgi:hypothetical protein